MKHQNVCRICFESDITLVSLFSTQNGISPFENIAKLKIDLIGDGPSLICSQCLAELDIAHRFLEKCEKSNRVVASRQRCVDNCALDPLTDCHEPDPDSNARCESSSVKIDVVERIPVPQEDVLKEQQWPELATYDCQEREEAPPRHVSGSSLVAVHTCPHCQKVFTRQHNFISHLKRHSAQMGVAAGPGGGVRARRACPEPGCGKSFTSGTNLATHVRAHTGERPHGCPQCGKSFTSKNTLTNHLRIHTGVKPYMCWVCGARFATNKLAAHARVHAAPPPARAHPCALAACARTFRCARAARVHARTHAAGGAGARALACPARACAARYRHSQSLNKHIRKHHPHIQKVPRTDAGAADNQTAEPSRGS